MSEGGRRATAIAAFTGCLCPSLTLGFAMGNPNHCGGCGSRSLLVQGLSLGFLVVP